MNLWNKIVLGGKFLFGGFDSAVEYLLEKAVNPWLSSAQVVGNVERARHALVSARDWLAAHADWCPKKMEYKFAALMTALNAACGALADGQITYDEVERVTAAIVAAKTAIVKKL